MRLDGFADLLEVFPALASDVFVGTMQLLARVCRQYDCSPERLTLVLDDRLAPVTMTRASQELGYFLVPLDHLAPVRIWLHTKPTPLVVLPAVPMGSPYHGDKEINARLEVFYRERIASY